MSDDVAARLNRALSGRYTVERELGEGGMATVYLADDLKHHRKVALKVLRPEVAAVVGAERFLAEIRTTANLQHPHILPLFDSGEADSFLYYVMPYVEGETLQDRLEREKQLPVEEAVRIAIGVANALQAAHDAGVVHRDIKPANILLAAGEPVVADFGIALALGAGGGHRLTETGLSLGTPYYMSPEQATGDQHVGPSTDVYALGCVTYEMLVGDPPYVGSTAQAILGKIIQGTPVSATEARQAVPANVDAAIRKALEKIPADRFLEARAFGKALADPSFRHGDAEAVAPASPGFWKPLGMAATALLVVMAGVAAWALKRPEAPRFPERFESPFRPGQEPTALGPVAYSLSPDGSTLVYRGPGVGGSAPVLWVRRWSDPEATPIPGTEDSYHPRVSPDGRQLAFTQRNDVALVDLAGGPIRTLMEGARHPLWGPDGFVYAMGQGGIVRVAPTGGEPEQVTEWQGTTWYQLTDFLPGGKTALVEAYPDGNATGEVRLVDLATGATRKLVDGTNPRYVDDGILLFQTESGLMAATMDVGAGELTSLPIPVEAGVGSYSMSSSGKLACGVGQLPLSHVRLVWVTRTGEVTPIDENWWVDLEGEWSGWSLSPDGTRIAVSEVDEHPDIWIKTLPDGPHTRLTFSEGADRRPSWTPDSRSVVYTEEHEQENGRSSVRLVERNADGTGGVRVLYQGHASVIDGFWVSDARRLVVRTSSRDGANIFTLASPQDTALHRLVVSDFQDISPTVSPDGRWLAYASDEQGTFEVFVRPFPDSERGKWQVSTEGGVRPAWSTSSELTYVDGQGRMVAATVEGGATFRVVSREVLFSLPDDIAVAQNADFYDVVDGGRRFIMAQSDGTASRLVLVNNFDVELRRRLGG